MTMNHDVGKDNAKGQIPGEIQPRAAAGDNGHAVRHRRGDRAVPTGDAGAAPAQHPRRGRGLRVGLQDLQLP